MIISYTSIVFHLSLEQFYNQGIPPEESKKVIEQFTQPSGTPLYAKPSGLNHNLNFEWLGTHQDGLWVCACIEDKLHELVQQKHSNNKTTMPDEIEH